MIALARVPRRWTYRMQNERSNNRIDRPIRTGASQSMTRLAVAVPANPSRARIPAVVQVGAAPARASTAADRLRI
jgi:hypothetical protein